MKQEPELHIIEGEATEVDPSLQRKANRKERRDFVRAQHRGHRLAYGFGLWRKTPGFITPARGDKA